MTDHFCPCGSQRPYEDCCGPFHRGTTQPLTAEALMRSRYSAFVLHHAVYLVATLHPDRRSPNEIQTLRQSFDNTQWEGLIILHCEKGQQDDQEGIVEFVARYRNDGHPGTLHERSRFIKTGEQWLYVEGELKPSKTPGRNDPCWCGSGKKFKKCHG